MNQFENVQIIVEEMYSEFENFIEQNEDIVVEQAENYQHEIKETDYDLPIFY